jgi:hypothetical protein
MSSSKIQRYDVDFYNLRIKQGGLIELDAGNGGQVRIDGDLTVLGNTTTISSTDLVIEDNTITINKGELGIGVSQGTAGLVVDRGLAPNVGVFFDESRPFTNSGTVPIQKTFGAFVFGKTSVGGDVPTGETVGIYTNTINTTNGNDLYVLSDSDFSNRFGANGPRLTVFQTTDYEERIFPYVGSIGNRTIAVSASQPDRISRGSRYDDDIIPNIKAVTDYVKAHYERNFQHRLISPGPDGFVSPGNFATGFSSIELFATDAGDLVSKIEIRVNDNSVPVASYFETNVRIFDIDFSNNVITTSIPDGDLVLTGDGLGSVKVMSPLNLPRTSDPLVPTDGTSIYAKQEADGGTGLYFVNDLGTRDELISRNKALLYSIIF